MHIFEYKGKMSLSRIQAPSTNNIILINVLNNLFSFPSIIVKKKFLSYRHTVSNPYIVN